MNKFIKHIILGAGGAIGKVLSDELINNNEKVKLVSRRGCSISGAEMSKADLTIYSELKNAVEDSSIVYLTAGLAYDKKIWSDQWPKIMKNTIDICKEKNARLIFFDNVYSYGMVEGKMTEETPYNPISKKGEIRAKIADKLMSEVKNNNINAVIARSADFYGPYSEKSSIPYILIIDKLSKGKKAQWMVNDNVIHSFTYTADCGKALFQISKNDEAFNQVWHLPTAHPPITGKDFINTVAEKLGCSAKYTVLKSWMIKSAGLFDKQTSELHEMLYQYKYDYIFDSSKFENKFNFTPTSYELGISNTLKESAKKNHH